jgi:DNA (cytosine-5)-methyltransferase 1
MKAAAADAASLVDAGSAFIAGSNPLGGVPHALAEWLAAPGLGGVIQHESRTHMASDLARYLFAASYAQEFGTSPKLDIYPEVLLPAHGNAVQGSDDPIPFPDRFRVQCATAPGTTVVSHISKDGHYYIHPDPSQCRSLTVREAARLQTFPEDYFFEGNRTQQYVQVGNAVPPLLASKIARIVHELLGSTNSRKGRAGEPPVLAPLEG